MLGEYTFPVFCLGVIFVCAIITLCYYLWAKSLKKEQKQDKKEFIAKPITEPKIEPFIKDEPVIEDKPLPYIQDRMPKKTKPSKNVSKQSLDEWIESL